MLSKTAISRTALVAAAPMLLAAVFSAAAQSRGNEVAGAQAAAGASERLYQRCLKDAEGNAVARQDSPDRALSRMLSDCAREWQQLEPLLRKYFLARGVHADFALSEYQHSLRNQVEFAYSSRLALWKKCMAESNGDSETRCRVFDARLQFENCLSAALDAAARQRLDVATAVPRAYEACDRQWDEYYGEYLQMARDEWIDSTGAAFILGEHKNKYREHAANVYPKMLARYKRMAENKAEMLRRDGKMD